MYATKNVVATALQNYIQIFLDLTSVLPSETDPVCWCNTTMVKVLIESVVRLDYVRLG